MAAVPGTNTVAVMLRLSVVVITLYVVRLSWFLDRLLLRRRRFHRDGIRILIERRGKRFGHMWFLDDNGVDGSFEFTEFGQRVSVTDFFDFRYLRLSWLLSE